MAAELNILFAAPVNLLDTTSGASLSMRTLLESLAAQGHKAVALQTAPLPGAQAEGNAYTAPPGHHAVQRAMIHGVEHLVLRTASPERLAMTAGEEHVFMKRYREELRARRPAMIIVWGNMLLECAIMREARALGIPVVFYLANGSYTDKAAFRDVSVIVTDTQATADLYSARLGLNCRPVGKFIHAAHCKSPDRQPGFITFINPSAEKGVNVFMPLARLAAREAPGIRFMVVQSRGRWATALQELGYTQDQFPNVSVIEAQADMKPVYSVTKALLVPSVWHESGGRVVVEALVNGIPVLCSRCGGPAELAGDAGVVFDLPDEVRQVCGKPAAEAVVRPWLAEIRRVWTDPQYYGELVARAHRQAAAHNLQRNTDRFLAAVQACLQQAGPTRQALHAWQAQEARRSPTAAWHAPAASPSSQRMSP